MEKEWTPEVRKMLDDISEKVRETLQPYIGQCNVSPILAIRRVLSEVDWPVNPRVRAMLDALQFIESEDQAVAANLYTAAFMIALSVGDIELPHPDEALPDGTFLLKDNEGNDALRVIKLEGSKVTIICLKPANTIHVNFTITSEGAILNEPSHLDSHRQEQG